MKLDELRNVTLAELAQLFGGATTAAEPTTWVDIRDPGCPVPYRIVLAAAQRGDLKVRKVGRRRLVKRDELDGWIERQPIVTNDEQPAELEPSKTAAARILEREGWRRAG